MTESLDKEMILRPIPKKTYVDDIIGNDLEKISNLNMKDRMVEINKKFRTITPYKSGNNAGPFIIQYVHNNCWIDWLEVEKPSSDPLGYGLFALQDIRPWKFVSLYLGNEYHSIEDHKHAQKDNVYTLMSNVAHNGKKCIKNIKKGICDS